MSNDIKISIRRSTWTVLPKAHCILLDQTGHSIPKSDSPSDQKLAPSRMALLHPHKRESAIVETQESSRPTRTVPINMISRSSPSEHGSPFSSPSILRLIIFSTSPGWTISYPSNPPSMATRCSSVGSFSNKLTTALVVDVVELSRRPRAGSKGMMLSNAEVEGSNPAFKAGDAFARSREDVSEDALEI
jgi:hypothetical protein